MGLYEQIKELARLRKISIAQLERDLDLSNGSISKWSNNTPSIDKIEKVANYFGVSVDYILGREVPEWADKKDIIDLARVLEEKVNMAYGGEDLTPEEIQRVQDIISTIFWDKRKKNKK